MPFFSIIIPLYNSARTLDESLNSIAGQSFKNHELIFVDGGSTDNTLTIIGSFTSRYPTITVKLISGPDKGIYDAMNKGIDRAAGEWVYFMGGDDILYSPVVLAEVSEAIKQEEVDLVYGNVWGALSEIRYADDTVSNVLSRGIHHQGVFYKRHLFNHTGKYSLDFKIAADYHLTLKVFCNEVFKTRYINADIARFGEAGLSSTAYDYRFFSYHYKFLALNKAAGKIDDASKCLDTSVYCCLYLARQKKDMRFAWGNVFYYMTKPSDLGFSSRVQILLRMIYWSLKPCPVNDK
jgi:glycosyltransferase involved in cell wall biosynthesis